MIQESQEVRKQIGQYIHIDDFTRAVGFVSKFLGPLDKLTILEAGCGSGSYLDLANSYVVGIDISWKQLKKNRILKERCQGDLHTYNNDAWSGRFDLIVCWDVLEHLYNPKLVIERFMKWVKPAGIILLAYPNPQALKATVTKYTPLSFHRLAKRLARPGTGAAYLRENTFKTYMKRDIRLNRIIAQAMKYEAEIPLLVSHQSVESHFYKKFFGERLMDSLNNYFLADLRGFIDKRTTDFILLIRKAYAGDREPIISYRKPQIRPAAVPEKQPIHHSDF